MQRPFPAYDGSEPYVFVSYAHEDASAVYPELVWLEGAGFNLWYDEGISPGEEWSDELARRIEGASTFLYFVSPRSVESRNCRSEVQFALKRGKRLLAVHVEPTELPRSLDLSIGLDQAVLKHDLAEAVYRDKLATGLAPDHSASSVQAPARLGRRPRNAAMALGGLALTSLLIAALAMWRTSSPEQPARIDARPTVAVLPFNNLSDDAAQDYFSDGVSEDVLNGLAKHRGLIVRARTSSFTLKGADHSLAEIGRLLNVSHAVEGSVRRDGNQIRVTAQLVSVAGDRQIWSERYDRELVDVFAVQDEITAAILAALQVHLLDDPHERGTADLAAYDAYLRGREHIAQFRLDEALAAYHRAASLDPGYADAWAALAQVTDIYAWVGLKPPLANRVLVRGYTARALNADPEHPHALAERALDLAYFELDFQAAIDHFERLAERYPSNDRIAMYYGFVMSALGQHQAAVELAQRVVTLDPLSAGAAQGLATALVLAGRLSESRAAWQRTELLGLPTPGSLALLALADSDFGAAQRQLDFDETAWGTLQSWRPVVRALIPYLQGDKQLAAELIESAGTPAVHTSLYVRHLRALVSGEVDRGLGLYEEALTERDPMAIFFINGDGPTHRLFADFYQDPRFARLREQVHLDPASIAALRIPSLAAW